MKQTVREWLAIQGPFLRHIKLTLNRMCSLGWAKWPPDLYTLRCAEFTILRGGQKPPSRGKSQSEEDSSGQQKDVTYTGGQFHRYMLVHDE